MAKSEGKSSRASRTKTEPVNGVRTPGVQIPFGSLKSAAEVPVPGKPAWIYFADSVFVPGTDALARIDPKTNGMDVPVKGLENPCGGMTAGFGSLWLPVCGDGTLVRIDAKELKIRARMAIGADKTPGSIATTSDSIWMLTDGKTTLTRIDPGQNTVVAELRLPAGCESLISGEDALWVACPSENRVFRINPATNLVEQRIEVSAEPEAIAVGEKSVWVYCRKDGKVDRIDPKTNTVSKTIDLGVPGAEGSIAFGEGSVWVTTSGFPITRIDPAEEAVVQQFYGDGGGAIRTSPGALWVSGPGGKTIERIDPRLVSLTLAE